MSTTHLCTGPYGTAVKVIPIPSIYLLVGVKGWFLFAAGIKPRLCGFDTYTYMCTYCTVEGVLSSITAVYFTVDVWAIEYM